MIAKLHADRKSGPAGALVDGCGRRVDHLRLSVTSECDLRCMYCRPGGGRGYRTGGGLSDRQRVDLVRFLHARYGLSHVRLTGGEPLVYGGLVSLIGKLRGAVDGLSIAMTTNGRLLAAYAGDLRRAGLDRINISVDSLDAARYRRITGGKLEDVMRGLEAAAVAGFGPPKINTVVLRGENDAEILPMVRFAMERGCEIRFLEVMPIGPAAAANQSSFVSAEEVRSRLADHFPISPLPREMGATARRYRIRIGAREGVIGFIAPVTEPFCADCRRMRVTAEGALYPCLLDDRCADLRSAWSSDQFDPDTAAELIQRTIQQKAPAGHQQATPMVQLGG